MGCRNGNLSYDSPQPDSYFTATHIPGGHPGSPHAAACGIVVHRAKTAAASNSNVFFTVKLLIEVGLTP